MTEQAQAPAPAAPSGAEPAVTSNDRLMAGLSYIIVVILPIVILIGEESKKREFQRYHAIQSIGLTVAAVVYSIALTVLSCLLTAVKLGALNCLVSLLGFVPLLVFLFYAYQAYQGQRFEIPVLTQFMRQQKWL